MHASTMTGHAKQPIQHLIHEQVKEELIHTYTVISERHSDVNTPTLKQS